MLSVLALILFVIFLIFGYPFLKSKKEQRIEKKQQHSPKYTAQMKKLWQIAQVSMKERKPLKAEKALLTILKFDEKNAAAYNRLGILYAKEQKYDEAIECFEIAQSLDSNPSSLHNAGLIYLETGSYEKAILAFEQAIKAEGNIPTRYIALAKSYEKLGDKKKAIESLESAYALDRSITTLRQILALYELSNDENGAAITTERIKNQLQLEAQKKRQKIIARKTLAQKTKRKVLPKRTTK